MTKGELPGWRGRPPATTGWITVSAFYNGWTNFDSRTAQYRRDGNVVRLRGIIKSGSVGYAAFYLPAGFRPEPRTRFDFYAAVISNNAHGTLAINGADGEVNVQAGSNVYVTLDVSFIAA